MITINNSLKESAQLVKLRSALVDAALRPFFYRGRSTSVGSRSIGSAAAGFPGFESQLEAEIPTLLRVAKRLTRNAADAEDLVGQTILKALSNRHQFDGEYLRSWLVKILTRIHFRHVARANSAPISPIESVEVASEDFHEVVQRRMIGDSLLAEVDRLPESFRLVVVLCDVEELSYAECATALEIPIGTVRSRLSRGRDIIRTRLRASGTVLVEDFETSHGPLP